MNQGLRCGSSPPAAAALVAERRAVTPGDHTPVCAVYDDEENKSDVCCGLRGAGGCQLALEQRRCEGRWGSQREQTEHLHLKTTPMVSANARCQSTGGFRPSGCGNFAIFGESAGENAGLT